MSEVLEAVEFPEQEDYLTTLAEWLSDTWCDERCDWKLVFLSGIGSQSHPWLCSLEWTQEYGNPHEADWATFTWEFYGATPVEAFAGAITWVENLLPWERCGACGGEGKYGNTEPCPDCAGSGLASGAGG